VILVLMRFENVENIKFHLKYEKEKNVFFIFILIYINRNKIISILIIINYY